MLEKDWVNKNNALLYPMSEKILQAMPLSVAKQVSPEIVKPFKFSLIQTIFTQLCLKCLNGAVQ